MDTLVIGPIPTYRPFEHDLRKEIEDFMEAIVERLPIILFLKVLFLVYRDLKIGMLTK